MEEFENKDRNREEIFSKAVRAGKRTYFFDVKKTKVEEMYLTITESKRYTSEDGKFTYQKHKIFLYKEDFEKFSVGLEQVIAFIETGEKPVEQTNQQSGSNNFSNVDFDDLSAEKTD